MSDLRHHPVFESLVCVAVGNLQLEFPDADSVLVRDLVSEAFVRITNRGKAPAFVAMLAERHVREVLARERRAQPA